EYKTTEGCERRGEVDIGLGGAHEGLSPRLPLIVACPRRRGFWRCGLTRPRTAFGRAVRA
ncbi:MAG TPA: hypothetical protein PLV85_06620, partial [Polyangiaceae bacterium]|nr:hypothetical protein [Polyangiaceae bacterium]